MNRQKKTTDLNETKNKGGRPKKEIDYAKLDSLCFIHCTGEEICSILDVSYEHLNNKLKKEKGIGFLDYFKEKSSGGKMSLRRRQFKMAETNPTMAIWLGKNILKQSDVRAEEIYEREKAKAKAKLDALKESYENSSGALAQYIEEQIKSLTS